MDPSSSPAYSPRLPQLAKYDVIEEIGHGGMATVYRAHDSRLCRDVAVKVLHAHLRDSEEVGARFATEAKAVAKLRHPNIVEVYDVSGEDEHERFLVVELVRGQNLRALLRQRSKLPAEVAAALAVEILQALAHAHAHGVVHRDIKPENVMIEHVQRASNNGSAHPGERCHIKLMDFGIAKLIDAQGVTSTGQVLGSPAHMAPEQIEGGEVDARADVYAVGVLLYECLVGDLPFRGTNPAQVLRRVLDGQFDPVEQVEPRAGKRMGDLVARALAQSPADRPESAAVFRDLLLAELTRLDITTTNGTAKEVLEAYLDDPETFTTTHDAFLLERLCALGKRELNAGQVLAAANDYNRALALDPHNPELLRTVTKLRRGQARGRLLRAIALPATLVLLLGVSAYGATRWWASQPKPIEPPAQPVTTPTPSASTQRPATPRPSASSAEPAAPPATAIVTAPTPAPAPIVHTPPKPQKRYLVFGSVIPGSGVEMVLDGKTYPIQPDGSGGFRRIEIDADAHDLHFQCARDFCERITLSVGPGDRDAVVNPRLVLREVNMIIEGYPGRSYQIANYGVRTVSGGAVRFRPRMGTERLRVNELETEAWMEFTLEAGRSKPLVFKPDPRSLPGD